MTSGADPNPVIAEVLRSLRQSRGLLLDPSPSNIDCCRVVLAQSVQKVVSVMEANPAAPNKPELTSLLLDMRSELGAIGDLLDSAAAFRRNMLKATPSPRPALSIDIDPEDIQTVARVHVLG